MGLPYTTATDIWSAGVSFAYIANFEHLFREEDNNLDQLRAIFEVLGVPTQEERELLLDYDWDQLGEIPGQPARPMELLVPRLGPVGADLVSRMLELVPQRRLTVEQAMQHEFFDESHNPGDWGDGQE